MREESLGKFLVSNFTGGNIVNEEFLINKGYSPTYLQTIVNEGYIKKIRSLDKIQYIITDKGKIKRDK